VRPRANYACAVGRASGLVAAKFITGFLARFLTSRTFLSENRSDRARGEATSSALSVLPALYHSLREDFRVNSKGERENRSDLTRG